MRLPRPPRNFNDLFDRIIFEQDSGESTIGSIAKSFGTSVVDEFKNAYNLTANPLGIGVKTSKDIPTEYNTFYKEYNIPPEESKILNLLIEEYDNNINCRNEIKIKSLRLSSGEAITFDLDDFFASKKITYKTLLLNRNVSVLRDNRVFQTFYTKFMQSDMSGLPMDPLFLAHLDEVLDNYLNSTTTSAGTLPTTPTPTTSSEKTELQTSMLNFIKKIKKGKRTGTYKDVSLYIKVFLVFISVQKGSQLF